MTFDDEIRALQTMDLEGLRAEWRRSFGPPPRLRSVELMGRLLAWRLQVQRHGDLDAATRRRLRERKVAPGPRLNVGARLVREWKGERHEVEVTGEGFLYAGQPWKTLSRIARAITGTRWNGPRFFGLREAPGS